ncbi:hypothetical protein EW145_g1220 [Phellinidium pouzarii]|uniref:Glutamate--tRNA ligase, mitochondrial n=1 Tax=Phellinidium pouzarii TaxID=167371 RepID=A0A4S4LFX6_9AGAM|nr:hypothetical protein EW145_g1220 [Phellinidium pouzarii]
MHIPKSPVLRFAPSPTGSLHLGGLRTALYNYLISKKYGGKWILRIEDTDTLRTVPSAVENIRKSLEWAGLEYDYGPGVGGPHGSYFQSERLDLYRHYVNRLVENGHAYHCFCTPSHLKDVRDGLSKRGSNATYDKTCLRLSEEEVARKKRAGEKFVIRLNDESIPARSSPTDLVFGSVKDAHSSLPTDPILHKSDGFPTYHLASVVDDHSMGITHVLRGEEWLPSLALHLDLYACLGLAAPRFAHLPLLLNADGSKMSKRKGDVSVTSFVEKGWMAPTVLNWLALAGWGSRHTGKKDGKEKKAAPTSTEVLDLNELIKQFDLSALTPRRTILDPKKLEVLNKKHLQRAIESEPELEILAKKAQALIEERYGSTNSKIAELDFKDILLSLKERLGSLNELPFSLEFMFNQDEVLSVHKATATIDTAINSKRYADVLSKYIVAIEESKASGSAWDESAIRKIEDIREERDELVLLRRALTGKKVRLEEDMMFKYGCAFGYHDAPPWTGGDTPTVDECSSMG